MKLPRSVKKRTVLLATAVAVSALVVPLGISAAASAAPAHQSSSTAKTPKPTIVLVHGAWASGASFAPEVKLLQKDGYKVLVAPNPLRSLAGDTTVLENFLKQQTTGPVVLVAHSYGGMVITGAALSDPDVKALVYIDGFVPADGESSLSLTDTLPGSMLNVTDPTTVFNFVLPTPDAAQADYDSYIKPEIFKKAFAGTLSTADANVYGASQEPATLGAISTPFSGTPAWKTIPSFYFVGTKDNVIPPAEQIAMAKRAGSYIYKYPSPHLGMIAAPHHVTALIVKAAKSVH
jgi:pimeloyl-ACP methyl ester carboxylesterase